MGKWRSFCPSGLHAFSRRVRGLQVKILTSLSYPVSDFRGILYIDLGFLSPFEMFFRSGLHANMRGAVFFFGELKMF